MAGESGKPRLHLDADTSQKRLYKALLALGHDVTRTPNEWMALDAGDEEQLHGATQQGRIIYTFNIADFTRLARTHAGHTGILLAHQRSWPLPRQIKALERMLKETTTEAWQGRVRWLNEWSN